VSLRPRQLVRDHAGAGLVSR